MFLFKLYKGMEPFYKFTYSSIERMYQRDNNISGLNNIPICTLEKRTIDRKISSFCMVILTNIIMEMERNNEITFSPKINIYIIHYALNKYLTETGWGKSEIQQKWDDFSVMFYKYMNEIYIESSIEGDELNKQVYYNLCDKFSKEIKDEFKESIKNKNIEACAYDTAYTIWQSIKQITSINRSEIICKLAYNYNPIKSKK